MSATSDAAATSPYLSANRAPVTEEVTAFDLPVTGSIPAELEGRWLRNGPNPLPGDVDPATHHWFLGDGMVHGVRIRGGKAEWYRNRWLRSEHVSRALGEESVGAAPRGPDFGPNTSVGGFAGRTWALVEGGGVPMILGYELDTIGWNDFDGTLPGAFTAHPKYDPDAGELHAMTYWWPDLADHVQYVVVGADGTVTKTVDIPVSDMIMLHDMSLTGTYAILYDLPVTVDIELAVQGRFPFRWNPEREARVGLLPRDGGTADDVAWVPVEPCYVFHPLNAYDTADGKVILDVCRYDRVFDEDLRGPFGDSLATLDRWTVDPVARTAVEERISDRAQEFPRHADGVGGRPYRWGYTTALNRLDLDPSLEAFGATYKTDVDTGETVVHDHGAGRGGAEPVFVARENASAEDDGWLMVLVHDANDDHSELVILDAQDVAGPDVARITLPRRVPDGFHGNWVSDRSVPPPTRREPAHDPSP